MAKSLSEIVALTGGRLRGDGTVLIRDVASLEEASAGEIAFIAGKSPCKSLEKTNASAVIAADVPELQGSEPGLLSRNLILVENPHLAFAKVMALMRPPREAAPGIDPKAEIGEDVALGKGVYIGPFVVVEEGAVIEDGVTLHASVVIGSRARVGADSTIYAGAVVREDSIIGKRVIIHSNAVIGSDGFGYARDGARYVKIPQVGRVRLGDDVEIGASATIDRATLGETVIKRGAKIDNLVQVAHNVTVGEDVVLAAQTGIAGSTSIGEGSQFGGQVGVGGHIKIGPRTLIGAKSGISHDLPGEAPFSGIPAMPHGRWLRAQALYAKLPELSKKIKELERRLKEQEEESQS
ncbi:MAG: UDP-3-O-(3-hydroxymyristoyl)glucosamine N-acyltransferase [Thermodesulfobacteriota bacterium]